MAVGFPHGFITPVSVLTTKLGCLAEINNGRYQQLMKNRIKGHLVSHFACFLSSGTTCMLLFAMVLLVSRLWTVSAKERK